MGWLVDKKKMLKKFPGKGGWTFVDIPEIPQDPMAYFGWVVIRGFIEEYELRHYKLMPKGNGKLFLPVKAAIREAIKKEAGDEVVIKLKIEDGPIIVPENILLCFENESRVLKETFDKLSDSGKRNYLIHIAAAKTEKMQVRRIVEMMEDLSKF